ncbi:MAG: MATE family efflux transporter [Prevotellaceae bacterium]|jgi:putative MATE family efflux protein|nr:MATE family efflux transporter [Prevotellaceae bacterium]
MTHTTSAVPNFKKIWYVSLPIMLSMFAQNIVSATDTAFMGHVGEVELGAAAIGGIYYYVLFMIGFGFATGMQILISRRKGENKLSDIGPIMETGILFLWAMAVVIIAASIMFTPIIMPKIINHDSILQPSISFLNIRIYGLFFVFINVSFRALHVGTINTRPLTYGSIIMAITNIILDYVLIFGKFGFPKMGIEGAALASVIAEAVEAVYFIIYNSRPRIRKVYKLFYFKNIDLKLLKHTLDVSIFVMLQYFISLSTWLAFFIMIEKTGEQNLASSNIVRSIYGFITIPVWAYAAATSSFVSSAIGAGYTRMVPAIIRKILKIGIVTAILMVIPVTIFVKPILSIYTNSADLINLSVSSMYVILGANIIFACGCVPFNGLSGTGKTKVAMFIEMLALTCYMSGLYVLVANSSHNVAYIWFSEYVYWGFLLVFTLLYFHFGKWRDAKV